MSAEKKQKTPGSGRKAGVPNSITVAAKEAFALAFAGIGGTEKLIEWASAHPSEFYRLYARLIPTEINGNQTLTITAEADFVRHKILNAVAIAAKASGDSAVH